MPDDRTAAAAPPIDRRRTRRRRGGERARWLGARTANAARHALLIAGIGALIMIGALLTFVLIPRRADRALASALAALPPPRDTVGLLTTWRSATTSRDSAAARLAALRATTAPLATVAPRDSSAAVTPTASTSPSASTSAPASEPSPRPNVDTSDSATVLLQQQLSRVRQAPLIESYRALAASAALLGDTRARAAIDSMEAVHREREASAALGGPDARYAALTARLTFFGQRLEQAAEEQLASRRVFDAVVDARATDSTPSLLSATILVDTVLTSRLTAAESTVVRADSALIVARALNRDLAQQQEALRARAQVPIPPVAMLLAALVLGVSVGFAVVLLREMRQPKVGDADELEALTHAQVIVHSRADRRSFTSAAVRSVSTRPREDDTAIAAIQPNDDAWPLLQLLLTTTGDVSRAVQVLADRPLLAGAVGLNLAAASARESRATVLIDVATNAGAMVPLIPTQALRSRARSTDEPSRWDATRALPLGRDIVVDLVLPRRLRQVDAPLSDEPSLPSLVADYDLAVYVADEAQPASLPAGCDVVLCARLSVTPLSWLADAVRAISADGRRVRAVLLWAGELPLAG